MSLSEELAEWIAELRRMWFGKIPVPLSHLKRFFYTFVGAFTFFLFLVILRLLEIPFQPERLAERRDVISQVILNRPEIILAISFAVIIFPSIWSAWLVSWQKHPYSPLRLYLAGLTFPALVSFILIKFFKIG